MISPYSSFLALMVDPAAAVEEPAPDGGVRLVRPLRILRSHGLCRGGRRSDPLLDGAPSGHELLAICNLLFDNPMQRYFHAEPQVLATELLLHERVPRRRWSRANRPDRARSRSESRTERDDRSRSTQADGFHGALGFAAWTSRVPHATGPHVLRHQQNDPLIDPEHIPAVPLFLRMERVHEAVLRPDLVAVVVQHVLQHRAAASAGIPANRRPRTAPGCRRAARSRSPRRGSPSANRRRSRPTYPGRTREIAASRRGRTGGGPAWREPSCGSSSR